MTGDLVIGLFDGPGGWSEGLTRLGVRSIGIEWDWDACKTATAAGHPRIQADVSTYPTGHLRGKVRGLTISPPCTTFSVAGAGAGNVVMDVLAAALIDTLRGSNVVARTRHRCAVALRQGEHLKARPKATRAERSAWVRRQAFTSCLVLEVARWIRDVEPEWFACEQVRGVMPLWRLLAHELRALGYSTWTDILNAADYGVPQTRQRAILTGSKVRRMHAPAPTHCKGGSDGSLFGELKPWVSMASALGWGATDRPIPTITAGGTATGGAEPLARGGREALARSKRGGRGCERLPAREG